MKQKIFRSTFLLSLVVLVICSVLYFALMLGQMREQAAAELRAEAAYVAAGLEEAGEEYLERLGTARRITLVEPDGSVSFDNRADPETMENHRDRSEIADAMLYGSGESTHYSGTMMETTLYYACLLPDGTVLRVSAPYESALSMLLRYVRPLTLSFLIVLLLSLFMASRLSRQITRPINAIDPAQPGGKHIYPELDPLVQKIRDQNRTIRSQMEELLRKQREFSAITDNMSEGLLLIGGDKSVLFANNSALRILGGEEIKTVAGKNCPEELRVCVDTALSGQRGEMLFAHGERILQFIGSPVIASARVSGVVLLILDVTEREKRDELRREFSANVSHELKTPLTSIMGFAELMKEGIVDREKMLEFSQDIYNESRRMLSLVGDIIRLSGLDEGGAEPEREPVELLALCGDTASQLEGFARSNGVSVSVAGQRGEVIGNRVLLAEMVYNLCQNAIQYNKPGGSVEMRVEPEKDRLRLIVRDTGIGIAPDHRSRIFERFYRVDKSHSRATGGTGLGLSIVRRGAMLHNAEIELKSEEGRGSEFTLIFPRGEQNEKL